MSRPLRIEVPGGLYHVAYGRVGHVFQGRFKAVVVQRESYLLELTRYVVLNPVRVGIGLPRIGDDLKSQLYLGDDDFAQSLPQ